MIITFDLSGRTRKELVKAISEIMGERAIYKFMPTSAFEIDFFTVTREGKLEFPDRSDTEIVEQVLEGLSKRGYTMISSYYDNGESAMILEDEKSAETATQPDRKATVENNGIDRFSISMSRDFFDEHTLNKLDRTIENKGELFKMAFKTDDISYMVTDDRVTFD